MRMVHDLVSDMVGTRTGAHGRTHDGGDRQMHDEGDNRQREGDVSAATGGRIPALVMRMCLQRRRERPRRRQPMGSTRGLLSFGPTGQLSIDRCAVLLQTT